MRFYKELYIGDGIDNPSKVKRKLRLFAGQLSVYVIAVLNESGPVELYHCGFLKQKFYKKNKPYIIGIASSKEEGVELITKMTQDALNATGSPDIISYLFGEKDDSTYNITHS